jgi:hypothetical protein
MADLSHNDLLSHARSLEECGNVLKDFSHNFLKLLKSFTHLQGQLVHLNNLMLRSRKLGKVEGLLEQVMEAQETMQNHERAQQAGMMLLWISSDERPNGELYLQMGNIYVQRMFGPTTLLPNAEATNFLVLVKKLAAELRKL